MGLLGAAKSTLTGAVKEGEDLDRSKMAPYLPSASVAEMRRSGWPAAGTFRNGANNAVEQVKLLGLTSSQLHTAYHLLIELQQLLRDKFHTVDKVPH